MTTRLMTDALSAELRARGGAVYHGRGHAKRRHHDVAVAAAGVFAAWGVDAPDRDPDGDSATWRSTWV